MKNCFSCLTLLLLVATASRADLPPNNIWNNPTFETGDSLDLPAGTPTGWNRGGNNAAICQVSTDNSVSATHSLAVNDTDAAGYGEWYSDLELAGLAAAGDDLDLHWHELFNISGGEMRLTLLFFNAANGVIGERHFVTKDQSAGWAGSVASSPFVIRNERVPVPDGAVKIRLALVSGGPFETTGVMLVDDFSVARHRNPILLANNFWHNPTFELGDNLDQPSGTPTNWNRGGNNATLCQVSTANSVSPTHSLIVDDSDGAGYAEWYSDLELAGQAAAGDEIDVQWFQMHSTSGGEMRLTILFFNAANNVAGTFHFVVNGDSPGWTGDQATSPFEQRKERMPIAAGAVKMRVALVSGGPQTATGFLMIDDLSAAKVPPQIQEILAGNFRPNPGFEEGENLNQPTGTPTGWNRGGSDSTIDQVSMLKSISAAHSLAIVDNNADGYGEWYSDQPLPCLASEGRLLNLQWFELFDITGGDMRVTVLFFNAASAVAGERHYVVNGQSAGWAGSVAASPFVRRNEQLAIPPGAKTMRVSLVSGGPASVTGTLLVDNFSVAVEPAAPTLLFGTIWPNGAFEDGANLDQPANGLPTGWQRGGNDATIDVGTTENSASSTHALAVKDNSATGYGEWYANVNLAGRASGGDALKLQWFELFNVSGGGEMRLTVLFWDATNALLSEKHYVAKNQSAGWAGDLACSTFTKRNEEVTVPAGATRLQVSLVSGGPAETTGVMVIDDFSVAKPLPPPLILARNFWPNPTFEDGAQLDNPTAGAPTGWNRGGSDSRGDVVLHDKAPSPTHALAVVDTNPSGYSEWYASTSLEGIAAGGDSLDVQWQQVYDTTGQMRLTLRFFDAAGADLGHNDFTVNGQSPDWTGDLATSPFEKKNERVAVPDGAVRIQFGLASGGGLDVLGTMVIDDLSVSVVTNDSDGDGMTDADEVIAGTNPADPNSVLKASLVKEAGGYRVTWASVPGKEYAVEFAKNPLGAEFLPLPAAQSIPASEGPATSFLDTTAAATGTGYYRVKLGP